ncbi:MAG: copper resistance protein CopC [Hyphomonadaceae bacterium]|jgi:methionine-rich copper-binding protein CopC|nr:copper resistance protein CopC [Hyphomonadaceae bacterium]
MENIMSKLPLMLGAVLALFATAPLAAAQHNHGSHGAQSTIQTTPTDGAMGAAPQTFNATFEHPMRLTALVITPSGGDPIAVTVPASVAATTASVALPRLAPGNYTFAWTASGDDNHTMTGRVRYMVH